MTTATLDPTVSLCGRSAAQQASPKPEGSVDLVLCDVTMRDKVW